MLTSANMPPAKLTQRAPEVQPNFIRRRTDMSKLFSRILVAAILVIACALSASAQTRPEVDAQNKKMTEDIATVARTFKAGNEALAANRLDEAIAAYREGLAIRPDEPALLANLSEALRRRGTNTYDETLKDPAALVNGGKDTAAKDWLEAAEASQKALRLLNRAGSDPQQQGNFAQTRLAAYYTRARAMRLVATKVDQSRAHEEWDAYQKLIGVEPDAAKKGSLKTDALQMLYEAGELDMAIAQARISLAQEPSKIEK